MAHLENLVDEAWNTFQREFTALESRRVEPGLDLFSQLWRE